MTDIGAACLAVAIVVASIGACESVNIATGNMSSVAKSIKACSATCTEFEGNRLTGSKIRRMEKFENGSCYCENI